MSEIEFKLNGEVVNVRGVDPHTTLLDWLRDSGRIGTKEGCAEGECGACAVAFLRRDPEGRVRYESMNSCLVLLPAVADQELVSVEGVSCKEALHPVQSLMAKGGGSQCGYCTPGFVVSLFAEYYRPGREEYDPESIGGNLCRCTGYRPIRDAAVAMGKPESDDPVQQRLKGPAPTLGELDYQVADRRFIRPTTLDEALKVLEQHPEARVLGGGTDLVVEANLWHRRWPLLLSLEGIDSLKEIRQSESEIRVGASVSLSHLEETLGEEVPIFGELFPLFSSRLIRNRATLGGNLVNASPIGDSPPALLALDARVVLRSSESTREVPLDEFFLDYRKTMLKPGELLTEVVIPKPLPVLSRFYKVSKRILDDISTVAAGFGLRLDAKGQIEWARFAYGGVAATPARALEAEKAVIGKPWNRATVDAVLPLLRQAFTPLSDHRGSASYRQAMVPALLEKFHHETAEAQS